MNEKEKGLISALTLDPSLLEKVTIPSKILSGQCLEIFNEIKRQFNKSQSFDYQIAADKLKMLASDLIFDGYYRLRADGLETILIEIESEKIKKKLCLDLNKEMKAQERTGAIGNLEKIEKLFFKLKALGGKELITTTVSDIEKRSIDWLWQGRIPKGMMTLVAGHPGVGKSFLVTWLIAKLSKGEALPDEEKWTQGEKTRPYSSLLISAEDDPSRIIRPRLEGNNANLSKIEIFKKPFDFSLDNLIDLETILNNRQDISNLVIDPLSTFLGSKIDYFRDPDVRRRLLPLTEMAKKRNLTVIGIVHFNKREDSELITKIGGSIAFAGVARSILGVSYDIRDNNDPDAQDIRLLSILKMNLMRKPDTLAFKIKDDLSINFEKESIKIEAEAIYSKEQRELKQRRSVAESWLMEYLKNGEKCKSEIAKAAEENIIPSTTLYRAMNKLKKKGMIENITHGFGKKRESVWCLKTP